MKLEVDTTAFKKAMDDLIARHDETMRRGLLDMSNKLLREARDRAPVDTGNLVNCIAADVIGERGKTTVRTYVPENSPASAYAIPMHEHQYNLGKNSQAKQGKVKVAVGPRYLARAVEENKAMWLRMIAFYVKKACKG